MPTGVYRRTAWHRKIMSLCHIGKMLGPKNPNWKGDKAVRCTGYVRAHRWFKATKCTRCGGKKNIERHHKDGNPLNNEKSNIAILCHVCHMTVDGRLEKLSRHPYTRTPEIRERNRKAAKLHWKRSKK
jgi:hypothetical protein